MSFQIIVWFKSQITEDASSRLQIASARIYSESAVLHESQFESQFVCGLSSQSIKSMAASLIIQSITNKEMENKTWAASQAELDGVSVRDALGHQLVSVRDLFPLKCGSVHLTKKSTPSKGDLEGQLLVSWQHPRGLLHGVTQSVAVSLRQKYWKAKRYFHLDYSYTPPRRGPSRKGPQRPCWRWCAWSASCLARPLSLVV